MQLLLALVICTELTRSDSSFDYLQNDDMENVLSRVATNSLRYRLIFEVAGGIKERINKAIKAHV